MSTKTRRGLLDVAEAAEYLHVTERWIRRSVDERRLPFFKVGHFLRFDPVALDEFLDANHVPVNPVVVDAFRNARARRGG